MDSRFPTHYLNDRRVMRLSPPTFRTFVMATAWSVSNKTDGAIPAADLPLVPLLSPEHATELVEAGLWTEDTDGYQITEFGKFQTSAAQMEASLENRRRSERERQARKRAKDREAQESPMSQGQSRDGHVTSEGRGRGKAEEEAEDIETSSSSEDHEAGGDYSVDTPDWWDQRIAAAGTDVQKLTKVGAALKAERPEDPRLPELRQRVEAAAPAPGPSELFGDAPVSYEPVAYDAAVWNEPAPVPPWARRPT